MNICYIVLKTKPTKRFQAEQLNKDKWRIIHQDGDLFCNQFEFDSLYNVVEDNSNHVKNINLVNLKYSKF